MFFLILERIKYLCLIYYSTEYMPIHFIVMKFDIAFVGLNVALRVFKEQLLNSLNEDWIAWFSKDM
jgi:hypothetical protein